jgi:hypothetical protein
VTPRGLFACVTENHPSWFLKVQNLVLSIREFGGSQARAPILVTFVEAVDDRYVRWLAEFDAETRVVEAVDAENRYANKLRMLEIPAEGHDVLIALDCDVVVVDDIADFVTGDALGAKPADADMLSDDQWQKIFRAADVPIPSRTIRTTAWGQRTYPYVNSGMLLIPTNLQERLLALWSRFLFQLHHVYESDGELSLRRKYNDQIALACALAAGLPLRVLPVGMNMPTHIKVHPSFRHQISDIRIVHYHAGLDDHGFILGSGYSEVDQRLNRFNRRRAEILGLPYDRLPRRSISQRIKQSISSQRWYHSSPVERLKATLRGARTSARAQPSTGNRSG